MQFIDNIIAQAEPIAAIANQVFSPIQNAIAQTGITKVGPVLVFSAIVAIYLVLRVTGKLASAMGRSGRLGGGGGTTTTGRAAGLKNYAQLIYFFGSASFFVGFVLFGTFVHSSVFNIGRKVVPAIWASYNETSLESLLPLHPKNLTESFEYGRLYEQAELCSKTIDATTQADRHSKCINAVLKQARAIANGAPDEDRTSSGNNRRYFRDVSLEELKQVASVVRDLDNHKGPIQRVMSLFSFVGFLWFISIVGICCLIIPMIAIFFGEIIGKLFVDVIFPALVFLFKTFIMPFGAVFLFCGSLVAFLESTRYPVNDAYSLSGTMFGVLAIGLFECGWVYGAGQLESSGGHFEEFMFLTSIYSFALSFSLSVLHNSKILATVAVVALLGALSFSFLANTVLYCLFSGRRRIYDDGLARFLVGCFLVQLAGGCLNVLFSQENAYSHMLASYSAAPFQDPLIYVGTTAFFWVFLVLCFFSPRNENFHPLFVVTLLGYMFFGIVFGISAFTQVAGFYFGSYVIFWIVVLAFEGGNLIVGGFVTSVVLFFVANILSRNPELLSYAFAG